MQEIGFPLIAEGRRASYILSKLNAGANMSPRNRTARDMNVPDRAKVSNASCGVPI